MKEEHHNGTSKSEIKQHYFIIYDFFYDKLVIYIMIRHKLIAINIYLNSSIS